MAWVGTAKNFMDECVAEMQKVTWPDRDQLRNATWVVVLFTILISAVIWVMDIISRTLIVELIMSLFR